MSSSPSVRNADQLRDSFLRYFEGRGCVRLASDRLVSEDATTLFTVAGMQQFKEDFTGVLHHGTARATTAQKCMRTPDLDNVGRTQRHHTFFEMLGFFSFGDFFKREAIPWIWEFYTSPAWCALPEDRLRVSVFHDDDEAYEIWTQLRPHLHERGWIYRMGERDNFWPAGSPSEGPNGVCGPCSEIFFDGGPEYGGGDPTSNDSRFMEIGNIVFMQFERSGPVPGAGTLTSLPQTNIDFGGGLERLAMAIEGVATTSDTSLFMPIRLRLRALRAVGAPDGEDAVRERRIADHVRAAVFLIAEGIAPGNARQGYVLRRIVRRAYRDGARLGFDGPFLWRLVETVADAYGDAYPEVRAHRRVIEQTIRREEEDFQHVLSGGLERLDRAISELGDGDLVLPGAVAFDLHSTHGLPVDVTRDVLRERGLALDQAGFDQAEHAFREQSRAGSGMGGAVFTQSWLSDVKGAFRPTEFVGYSDATIACDVVAIVLGDRAVDGIDGDVNAAIVLDRTPFYAESGGQVGDQGAIEADGGLFVVTDTQTRDGYVVHLGRMAGGALRRGQQVRATPDRDHRDRISRNHSATHLLHAALRATLGDHVHQKGSVVDAQRLRFDFTHAGKVPAEQLAAIERLVNRWITENGEVHTDITTPDAARAAGALMFFGDTYGDRVRMLTMGPAAAPLSRELCGGTHVRRTGDIGAIRIVTEASVASGVRRIEAVTGAAAIELAQADHAIVARLSALLRVPPDAIEDRVLALQQEVKRGKRSASAPSPGASADVLTAGAVEIAGIKAIFHYEKGASMAELVALKDTVMASSSIAIALLAGDTDAKANLLLALSEPLIAVGLDAVTLMTEIASTVDGRGGGKNNLARAGGKRVEDLPRAIEVARRVVEAAVLGSARS